MKRRRLIALVIAAISFSLGFLGGRLTPGSTPVPRDDVWLSLHDEVKTLLRITKDSLAKGADFKAKVDGVEVSSSRITTPKRSQDSQDQLNYFLFLPDSPKPKFPALNGLLTLRKTDSKHVDVVFRPGFLQLPLMDVAVCVDDYEIGAIEWDTDRDRNNKK